MRIFCFTGVFALLVFSLAASGSSLECERLLGKISGSQQEQEQAEKAWKLATSQRVERALSTPGSVYADLHEVLKNFDKTQGKKNLKLSDAKIEFDVDMLSEDQTWVVRIRSLRVDGLNYGENSEGLGTGLYTFLGTLLRGVNENVGHVSNDFQSVRIIANRVVNSRLSETLKRFGFKVIEDEGDLLGPFKGVTGSAKFLKGMKMVKSPHTTILGHKIALVKKYHGTNLMKNSDADSLAIEIPVKSVNAAVEELNP